MSAVQTIPTASTSPNCQRGVLPSEPPASAGVAPPLRVNPPLVTGHSPSLPVLTPDQDRLFEALAKGQTSPAELAAALSLPVRQVLILLATPEIVFHLEALEAATESLARHTTRLRHNLAFKSLEQALTAAAAKDNPAEVRRIATLLLKPTPPLPDPEAELAERAERITKHRRAVKDDAKSEDEDAEINALAAAMVARANEPTRATDRLPSTGRCSVPATPAPQATHASPQSPSPRPQSGGGLKPGHVPPSVTNQPAAPATPPASTSHSPSHALPTPAPQHHPAQPRAA
ncbi:MAG: hypothetical protein ACREJO_02855 [Phycisphaerales bacterium]